VEAGFDRALRASLKGASFLSQAVGELKAGMLGATCKTGSNTPR
jgi:hypothetical protein